jgi:hypothetical protein
MAPPRPVAYLAAPRHRLRWITELQAAGVRPHVVRSPRPCRSTWTVRIVVDAPGVGRVRALLCFPWHQPELVRVYADAPSDSPHRFDDGALCMWYPYDEVERRWTRSDGVVVLVGHVIAHLAREEWWRRTGEWVGDQVPHGTP